MSWSRQFGKRQCILAVKYYAMRLETNETICKLTISIKCATEFKMTIQNFRWNARGKNTIAILLQLGQHCMLPHALH